MARVKVKMNRAGSREVMTSPGVKRLLQQMGDDVADRAATIAPVVSGQYANSIECNVTDSGDRATARIGSTVPYAATVEANHGVMVRALGAS